MAINYSPKVGEILECDFGDFREPALNPVYDGLIPAEIRKRRLVTVVNGKLPNNCVLVVPISSTQNKNAQDRGFHIPIPTALITITDFYDRRDRWAITECITHVSKQRLSKVKHRGQPLNDKLPRELMEEIQRALIKALNAGSLLPPVAAAAPAAPVEEVQ